MICDEHSECSTLSRDFMSAYAGISGLHWTTTEKVAVRTLSQPLNHLHFEFNYHLLNHTINCLNQVADLQFNGINSIRYEMMHAFLPNWVAPRDFIRCLNSYITSELLSGEILCRRVVR